MAGDADQEKSRSKKGLIALLLAVVGAVGFFVKKKRERELDEALWEEPRAL